MEEEAGVQSRELCVGTARLEAQGHTSQLSIQNMDRYDFPLQIENLDVYSDTK